MRELLKRCEDEVRAGRGHHVARLLAGLNTAKVPRELLLSFANVARRAGMIVLGLRLLTPVVHPERNKYLASATPGELAEYAVLLQKLGAVGEAFKILKLVDAAIVPEVRLYKTFCHFASWEYDSAIPELTAYLQNELSPYSRLVAQVNLAAALVTTERFVEAKELLDRTIEVAGLGGFRRLKANCFELRAQTHLYEGRFAETEADLTSAMSLLGDERTFDELFVRKWQAIARALVTGDADPVRAFREEAWRRQHWESVRECDLFLLKVSFDKQRFLHLVAGTPFPSYRARILRAIGRQIDEPCYVFGAPDSACLDLASGKISDGTDFAPGKKAHQVLAILLKDLYRPARLAGLFADLFPGEYFDIHSSPDRVHQVLRRTRRLLRDAGLPVRILQAGRNYRLEITGEFSFRLAIQAAEIDGNHLTLARLQAWLEGSPSMSFTSREARSALGLSLTGFNRFMNWAAGEGHLQRLGAGPRSFYRLVGPETGRKPHNNAA